MTDHDIDPSETILFVGAGLSIQLGLPSWSQLVGEIGEHLGYDPDIFRGFGSYLALSEYYQIVEGSIGGLRSILDVQWHQSKFDIGASEAHQLIVDLNFSRIYTTNFDRWIEKAFEHWNKPFHKITNVNQIAESKPGIVDVIKFHGDFDQDESLVLTESNYFDRLQFEAPLDILLRADALHKPILFIGYSLADINMRYLFHKLWKLWQDAKIGDARKRSYIFMIRPNPVDELIFKKWNITPIVDADGGSESLPNFLKSIKKHTA